MSNIKDINKYKKIYKDLKDIPNILELLDKIENELYNFKDYKEIRILITKIIDIQLDLALQFSQSEIEYNKSLKTNIKDKRNV